MLRSPALVFSFAVSVLVLTSACTDGEATRDARAAAGASGGAAGGLGAAGGGGSDGGAATAGSAGSAAGSGGSAAGNGGSAATSAGGASGGAAGQPAAGGEGGAPACIPVKPNEAGGGAVAYFMLSPPVGKSCAVEGIEVCGDDTVSGNPPAWSQCVDGIWATSTRTDPCPAAGCNVSHTSPIVEGSCCFGPPRFCSVFGLCDGTSWHPEPLAQIAQRLARTLSARRPRRCR